MGRERSLSALPLVVLGILLASHVVDPARGQQPGAGTPTASAPSEPAGPPNVSESVSSSLTTIPGGGSAEAMTSTTEEELTKAELPTPGYLDKALGLQDAPVHVYGWIENGINGNTNGVPGSRRNFALFPDHLASQWMGNQYYIVVENALEDNDEINFGFRIDTLFGNDSHYTRDYEFLDHNFSPPDQFNSLDFPQIYGEVHLPILTEGGIDLKGGRFYNFAGYEAVAAINRPLYSWAYTMPFFPFTFFGFLGTVHVNPRLDLFGGTINGMDRWIDQRFVWNGIGGLRWKSEDERTSFTSLFVVGPNQVPRFLPANAQFVPLGVVPPPFMAGKVNPNYPGSNRVYTSQTLVHQWTDKLSEAAEFDQIFDPNDPGFGPNGAPMNVEWYCFCHWFLYDFTDKITGVWRSDIFRDDDGAATGVADTYYEMTLGFRWTPKPCLWVRPEARYDWAQFKQPFNDGTRGSRFTVALDVIILF